MLQVLIMLYTVVSRQINLCELNQNLFTRKDGIIPFTPSMSCLSLDQKAQFYLTEYAFLEFFVVITIEVEAGLLIKKHIYQTEYAFLYF